MRTAKLRAFVHLAMDQSLREAYCVTVGDEDFRELSQWEFPAPQEAVDFLKERYGHWEFYDISQGESDGGCGSCSAH